MVATLLALALPAAVGAGTVVDHGGMAVGSALVGTVMVAMALGLLFLLRRGRRR